MSTPEPSLQAPALDSHVLATFVDEYRRLKALGDRALAQVPSDEAFNLLLDPESNSLVVIVRHMAGNMRSRWTDFLTTDGEKPTRDREGEFDQARRLTRDELLAEWEDGWRVALTGIESLTPADLLRTVTIRGEAFTVFHAIVRQYAHYSQHIGQILFLAKHLAGSNWHSLSIPRGQSNAQQWSYKQTRPLA
jgi:hypothetical protein